MRKQTSNLNPSPPATVQQGLQFQQERRSLDTPYIQSHQPKRPPFLASSTRYWLGCQKSLPLLF